MIVTEEKVDCNCMSRMPIMKNEIQRFERRCERKTIKDDDVKKEKRKERERERVNGFRYSKGIG
jgi:hypothetical protein